MGLLSGISRIIQAPLVGTANLITAGLEKITGKTYGRTTLDEAVGSTMGKVTSTIIGSGALAVGGILAAPAVATSIASAGGAGAIATKAATSLIPSTPTGKIAAVVAAPVIVGAVLERPKEAATAIIKAPSELYEFGTGLANVAANPSMGTVKELIKESPILTAVSAAAIGATVLKGGAGLLVAKSVLGTDKDKIIETEVSSPSNSMGVIPTTSPKVIPTSENKPIIPETTTISTGIKRRRKTAIKKEVPNVRINNVIAIKNAPIGLQIKNKRYLKSYAY